MSFYRYVWTVLSIVAAAVGAVRWISAPSSSSKQSFPKEFKSFQRNYLVVYLLVMCSDWLQGPYVFALYQSHGFSQSNIALLFVTGFFSSMLFGTFVGSLADTYGRKRLAIVFGGLYSACCLIKLSSSFTILMVGRILGGISTSLLFSVFESWMVSEHHKRGFKAEWLSDTFSHAVFGNGIVAILSGFLASWAASFAGYTAPFMVAIVFLVAATIIVSSTWTENYGASAELTQVNDGEWNLVKAVKTMKRDPRILFLGSTQALFEASMYVFVFMWTPSLSRGAPEFHDESSGIHGLIFAAFMIAVMFGSSFFGIFIKKVSRVEVISLLLLSIGVVSMAVPSVIDNPSINFLAFMLFEACCGLYFPTQGTLRSTYIPEDSRTTIMNLFRVPLNLLVVLVLHVGHDLEHYTVFQICSAWLLVGLISMYALYKSERPNAKRA